MLQRKDNNFFLWNYRYPPWGIFLLYLFPALRGTVLYRVRANATDYTGIDAYALLDIFALFLNCGIVAYYWKKTKREALSHSSIVFWSLFYVFCLLSVFWRVPGTSAVYVLYRAGTMLIMTLSTYFMFSRIPDDQSAFRFLMNIIGIIMMGGFLKALSTGHLHTNSYSACAALLGILCLVGMKVDFLKWKQVKWYFIFAMICLVCGTSSASNIAFLVGIIFYYCLTRKNVNLGKFIVLSILLYGIWSCLGEFVIHILFPGKTMEGIASATGRVNMWEHMLEMWKLRPLTGWGFCVGERSGAQFGYMYALHAHNGVISILVNTGLIGLFLWGMHFLIMTTNCYKKMGFHSSYAAPILAGMIVMFVNNMALATMGTYWTGTSMCVTAMLVFYEIFIMGNRPSCLRDFRD